MELSTSNGTAIYWVMSQLSSLQFSPKIWMTSGVELDRCHCARLKVLKVRSHCSTEWQSPLAIGHVSFGKWMRNFDDIFCIFSFQLSKHGAQTIHHVVTVVPFTKSCATDKTKICIRFRKVSCYGVARWSFFRRLLLLSIDVNDEDIDSEMVFK